MILSPALVLGVIISSLYGLVFYLVYGRGWRGLALYWVVAMLGFALGQWGSNLLGLTLVRVGAVNLFEATLASWLSLLVVHALWR